MKVNPDDTAFSLAAFEPTEGMYYSGGMTKREYAFWQCMGGLLASTDHTNIFDAKRFASAAMDCVNAGFAELNKESES